ncbi:hypothetical protein ACHAQA_004015 [Verticillium albo-atrum]
MSNLPTFYWTPKACSVVSLALLRHFDIPHNSVEMGWGPDGLEAADGSLSHAQYLHISATGYTPALVTGSGTSITETPAILTYIASLVATPNNILGAEGVDRAKVYEWLNWLSGTLHGLGYGRVFAPQRFTDDETKYDAVRAQGKKLLTSYYQRIEDRVKGKTYAVGSATTVADFYLYIFFLWGLQIGFQMKSDFPNYTEIVRRVEKVKGVAEAAEVHQLASPFAQESKV